MTQTERGCLFYFLRVTAVAVALMFILVSVATLVAFNLERQLFNPEVYKTAVDQQGFYERAPALIGSDLYNSIASGETTATALKNLSQSDLQTILDALAPPDWIKEQTESALDQFFLMLDSDDPPEVVISLEAVKQRMAGPSGVDTLRRLVASWPPCAIEQVFQAQTVISGNGELSGLPVCNPPESFGALLDPLLEEAARQIAANIPATVNLAESFLRGSVDDPRPTIRLIRQFIHFSPILPILLLLLIAALAVRQPKDLNTWWGIPLLLVGIIGIVMALSLSPLSAWALETIEIQWAQIPASLREVADRVLRVISQRAGLVMGAESVFIALVGFMFLVFGFTIWREDKAVSG